MPWHQSTRLTALEQSRTGPDIVDVLTRRDAKTGTTYVLRRIWCASREFQYLGEGATEAQAKAALAADIRRKPVAENSIPFLRGGACLPGLEGQVNAVSVSRHVLPPTGYTPTPHPEERAERVSRRAATRTAPVAILRSG